MPTLVSESAGVNRELLTSEEFLECLEPGMHADLIDGERFMHSPPFDALGIWRMASGHLCLNLTERLNWEDFPDFANSLLRRIGGEVVERADAVDIRLWTVRIGGHLVSLVFDDYPVMISLESSNSEGDVVVESVFHILSAEAS